MDVVRNGHKSHGNATVAHRAARPATAIGGHSWARYLIPVSVYSLKATLTVEVMLVGHIRFDVFVPNLETQVSLTSEMTIESFRMNIRTIDVSWIMSRASLALHRPEKIMRSMHFRGSLDIRSLSIPKTGAMFVNLFLADVHDKWRQTIESAKLHLARLASYPSSIPTPVSELNTHCLRLF